MSTYKSKSLDIYVGTKNRSKSSTSPPDARFKDLRVKASPASPRLHVTNNEMFGKNPHFQLGQNVRKTAQKVHPLRMESPTSPRLNVKVPSSPKLKVLQTQVFGSKPKDKTYVDLDKRRRTPAAHPLNGGKKRKTSKK